LFRSIPNLRISFRQNLEPFIFVGDHDFIYLMAYSLLSTKIYPPPPRPNGVERLRLLQYLDGGLRQGRRLTLVSAPAGFGKTTLVGSWVRSINSNCRVAWITLDSGENDPIQFLSYLITALQQCDPEIGRTILPALQSQPLPPLSQLVEGLINDFSASVHKFILVLDDYQLVNAVEVHQMVQLLLERGPLSFHLVILTREDPLLPLPRLRARGQMTEIRERDLRFNEPEAKAFFHDTMGLDLAARDVAVLEARTEGWIAGLQLAAIALQEQLEGESIHSFVSDFAGSDRFIVDYLASEVLQRQTQPVREFLMCTSILERLCGSLCDALMFTDGEAGKSQEMLESLERANMFISPLDNHRQWYRYHPLFADLLRHVLVSQEGDRLVDLHQRASQWFEEKGFLREAVTHAFKTRDWNFAAELIERHAMEMISRSQVTALRDWCSAFPEEVIHSRPGLCIFLAWSMMLTFRTDIRPAVESRLAQAEASLSQPDLPLRAQLGQGGVLVPLHDWVTGQVYALRSQLLLAAFNDPVDPQALIDLSLKSLELLPEVEKSVRAICAINLAHAHMMRSDVPNVAKALSEALRLALEAGNYYTAVTAIFYQARLAYHLGQLHRSMEICDTGLARLNPLFDHPEQEFPAIRSLYVAQAIVFLEWNDLETAGRLLELSTNLVGWAPWVELVGYAALVRLWEICGDESRVRDTLDRMQKLGPQQAYCAEALRLCIHVRQHPLDAQGRAAAFDWARAHAPDLDTRRGVFGIGPFQVDAECIALFAWLKVQIAIGRGREALEFIHPLLASAVEKGLNHRTIELSIMQAMAFQAAGETAPALEKLAAALALARPEGYHNTFRQGPELYRLLAEVSAGDAERVYIRQLLASFSNQSVTPAVGNLLPSSPARVEPLSQRELEILNLLNQGLSVPEIASRLFISVNTLKAHSQNIYSKLGVHNRVEAINTAREHGLI
jgi:LuxR family maltose regulon positive regulatory protein